MANFPLRQTFIMLSVGLAVAGCNDDRIHNICSNHAELCQDLVDDGWCRYERTDVIRSRFYLKEEGTDRRKYELMRNLERYLKCAERSTSIEYKNAREQKSPRVEGMLAAGDQLAQLDAATRNSQDPYLLLWHWTNNTNELARQQFMALEGTKALDEP
ncbi:DUF2989 domain-containing protein, partial [Aeromonas veronii]